MTGSGLSSGRSRLWLAAAREAPVAGRARMAGYPRRASNVVMRHRVFIVALILATALRIVVMIGFQPIFWFTDSASYLSSALHHSVSTVRPDGYSAFLAILRPLHSFVLIALLQHLAGLGTGVGIYALLRRRGLPGWGATLPALPVLFDAYQVQLEHLLLSDTLFIAMVVWVIVLVSWSDRPSVLTAAVAGLFLGYASVLRSVGLPLLVIVAGCLLLRRVGWRPIVALAGACAVPVAIYMADFQAQHGSFAMTDSGGVYLYDRVMSFADCSKINPPPSLAILCDPRPQSAREQPPIEYIWDRNDPIYSLAKGTNLFTPQINNLAEKFAERAILAQPLDYVSAVASDTLRSFGWASPVSYDPSDVQYLFTDNFKFAPSWLREMRQYQPGMATPRAVQPFSGFLISYQRWVYLRGTLVGLILLIGLGGIAARWRRRGGLVLLPWAFAAVLIIIPPLTVGFNSRYVLVAVPPACLAAGLAAIRQRAETASSEAPG